MTIQEYDLLQFGRCPLRVSPDVMYPQPDLYKKIYPVFQSTILKAFKGTVPNLAQLRASLDTNLEMLDDGTAGRIAAGMASTAKMLHRLVTAFKVVQPVSRYRWNVGTAEVVGEYAVVRRKLEGRAVEKNLYAVQLCLDAREMQRPNAAACARFCHLQSNEPAAWAHVLMVSPFLISGIRINHPQDYLQNIVRAYREGGRYPSPGPHCETCLTTACVQIG